MPTRPPTTPARSARASVGTAVGATVVVTRLAVCAAVGRAFCTAVSAAVVVTRLAVCAAVRGALRAAVSAAVGTAVVLAGHALGAAVRRALFGSRCLAHRSLRLYWAAQLGSNNGTTETYAQHRPAAHRRESRGRAAAAGPPVPATVQRFPGTAFELRYGSGYGGLPPLERA